MSKRNEIPPIKKTPGLGEEKANDPALVWTGRSAPARSKQTTPKRSAPARSKGSKRKTPQTKITLRDTGPLQELMELYGQSASTVVALAIKEYLAAAKKRLL